MTSSTGTQTASTSTPAAAPAPAFLQSLLKQAEANKKQATEAKTKRLGYGVFQTADGHVISLNYTPKGKEADWTLYTPAGKPVANFPLKRDAVAHWETKIAKKAPAPKPTA